MGWSSEESSERRSGRSRSRGQFEGWSSEESSERRSGRSPIRGRDELVTERSSEGRSQISEVAVGRYRGPVPSTFEVFPATSSRGTVMIAGGFKYLKRSDSDIN